MDIRRHWKIAGLLVVSHAAAALLLLAAIQYFDGEPWQPVEVFQAVRVDGELRVHVAQCAGETRVAIVQELPAAIAVLVEGRDPGADDCGSVVTLPLVDTDVSKPVADLVTGKLWVVVE